MTGDPKVKIFKASTALKDKAGSGKISQEKIDQAQNAIKNTDIDFFAFAKQNLDDLQKAIDNARQNKDISKQDLLNDIRTPLLQLKSSSALFEFDLVGILAGIMFEFTQKINHLDESALKIIAAHHTTLYAIISNKMMGEGGAQGMQLRRELADVCKKYFDKN